MKNNLSCTYIGHATVLADVGGTRIITDPHLGRRVLCFKRKAPLKLDPVLLDDLRCVLVSHMHYDHMDLGSYKYVSSAVPVIVPEGTEPVIGRLIPNPVIELSHWATHELVDGIRITAVPIHHRGGRLSQLRYTSSNGYIIEKDQLTVFFCGDSAYGPHFSEIGNLYNIDLALLPMGSYEPRWFMKARHMTPAEAVTAFEDTKANYMIPVHWGTFRLALEKVDAPKEWLEKILEDRPDLQERIFLLEPGASKEIPKQPPKPTVKVRKVEPLKSVRELEASPTHH